MKSLCFTRLMHHSVIALALTATPSWAQYTVGGWADFEGNRLPEKRVVIGTHPQRDVSPASLLSLQGMPPAFRSQAASSETGEFALRLHNEPAASTETTVMTGLVMGDILDRDQLGANGRALFQADIFLGAKMFPSIAVLAMEPPLDASGQMLKRMNLLKGAFYRFGFRRFNEDLYFSAIIPGQAIYPSLDKKLVKEIPRAGWHRLAIVLEDSDTIRCYVDGREASFSPVNDARIRKMVVGVVVIEKGTAKYDVFVDNLSIQVSSGDSQLLPESPYSEGWRIPPSKAVAVASAIGGAPALDSNVLLAADSRWKDPNAAWTEAQTSRKPLLLYFHAPGASDVQKANEWLIRDPAAAKFLNDHVCAKVDVNQLQGGMIASKYEVFKVPTFLVISPDAKAHAKALYRSGDDWANLLRSLALK